MNNKRNKRKVVVGAYLYRKKKMGHIIITMNCSRRNGQFRELLSEEWIDQSLDFASHIFNHPNYQKYSQHTTLWILFNISTIELKTRLIRVQTQHPIKQVGLIIHSKISLVENSDRIKYKTQNPCNENSCLKSTYL